jgi:hypothetical protein
MLQRAGLRLWSTEDVDAGRLEAESAGDLTAITAWARAFLNSGHPDLGRDGPVCPFTRSSMDKQLFYVTHMPPDSPRERILEAVDAYGDWYRDLVAGTAERDRTFVTILIVLPGIDTADSGEIDGLQRSLKDRFVRDGLMIGQFHPACDEPGLWNKSFRPLRAPIPLLAIRTMVAYDLPFLIGSEAHLNGYLAHFAPAIPPNLRALLTAALAPPAVASGTPA